MRASRDQVDALSTQMLVHNAPSCTFVPRSDGLKAFILFDEDSRALAQGTIERDGAVHPGLPVMA